MPTDAPTDPTALRFCHVDLERETASVLSDINWQVVAGQIWAMLGPNGCGKTTLLQLASGYLHPTRGTVDILGLRLGRTDVRSLRSRLAVVSASVGRMVLPWLPAREVVVSALHGALEPWWHRYQAPDRERAMSLLTAAGFSHVAERQFGQLSEGERQQVLLARALMAQPELLLLDEPCAGLDMGGRERLLSRLRSLALDATTPPVVLVTHHVEEIPEGTTDLLLLRQGRVLTSGAIGDVLTAQALSECFGTRLRLRFEDGRWSSRS
ncbi:MAG TPA: ATP-binding cassette domain-containing protein [Acidimicrobiales bacterium]|nr:ATP-binding cassette domain-containing protein [Acidimicrobiales bacterium]